MVEAGCRVSGPSQLTVKEVDLIAFRAHSARWPPVTPRGGFSMDRFVERQNIAHFEDQLKTEADPIKRAMLQRLLTEEKAKQAAHIQIEK